MVVCGSCFDIERATQWVQSLQGFIDRYGCPFLYAECRTYYGRVLFENGDWSGAEALLAEAISMSRGVYPAPHAFACGTLAELRLAQGRIEDAARLLHASRDARRPRPRPARSISPAASHRSSRRVAGGGSQRPARTGSMSPR